jgi:toxin ParE1/3/4
MAKVILRQEAINDLNNIWIYTFEEWSETQADQYYNTLKFACKQVGLNPDMGKHYNAINKNLLGLKIGKHIIFYHIFSKDQIEIIRILHERMDLKSKLNE